MKKKLWLNVGSIHKAQVYISKKGNAYQNTQKYSKKVNSIEVEVFLQGILQFEGKNRIIVLVNH
jgi:hypothetical protein